MITGLIITAAGLIAILFRKVLLRDRAAWQQNNFGLKFKPFDYKYGEVLFVVLGSVLILIGVLTVAGIIKFNR